MFNSPARWALSRITPTVHWAYGKETAKAAINCRDSVGIRRSVRPNGVGIPRTLIVRRNRRQSGRHVLGAEVPCRDDGSLCVCAGQLGSGHRLSGAWRRPQGNEHPPTPIFVPISRCASKGIWPRVFSTCIRVRKGGRSADPNCDSKHQAHSLCAAGIYRRLSNDSWAARNTRTRRKSRRSHGVSVGAKSAGRRDRVRANRRRGLAGPSRVRLPDDFERTAMAATIRSRDRTCWADRRNSTGAVVAKTREKIEFGDFQTPRSLADQICNLLGEQGCNPASIVEPTCGRGSMLLAALRRFPRATYALGVDINPDYLGALHDELEAINETERTTLVRTSFFAAHWDALLPRAGEPLLVIGNPPWVTNSQLGTFASDNLPLKQCNGIERGIEAITGRSNFDISEWMLVRVMEWFRDRSGIMAMLCKAAVARKLLSSAWSRGVNLESANLYAIDAALHFDAAVPACLLLCRFGADARTQSAGCYASIDAKSIQSTLGWRANQLVANSAAFDKWGHLLATTKTPEYVWRSGVKHDCARVVELREAAGQYTNGLGQVVEIESTLVYPMLKGSQVAHGRTRALHRHMIVTQTTPQDDTSSIRLRSPRTWDYLTKHGDHFDRRRSSIYRNRARFAMFGVGRYSFAPFKVAVAGLYKQLVFQIVEPFQDRPVVFDDTVYFLPCWSRQEAELLAELLNSQSAREFYSAFVFWDAKRPITVDILRRLDLRKLARELGKEHEFDQLISGPSQDFQGQGRLF